MECTFPELLTREDMLRILRYQRQLKISEAEITDVELLKIFKTFAVPLAKRQRRTIAERSPQIRKSTSTQMEIDEPMETDAPIKLAYLDFVIKPQVINSTEKRNLDYDDDDDESLTLATKRIKLTWP